MARPLFSLGARLEICADMLTDCEVMADVGTDHALLPIWLIKSGKVKRAIVSDLRSGPLMTARSNAAKYRVENHLETRLSDGLSGYKSGEIQGIVIAGMGGSLILRIVGDAPWLSEGGVQLVLQPMSQPHILREGLYAGGFEILEEKAVSDNSKLYSVMSVKYTGYTGGISALEKYMGKLEPMDTNAMLYAEKICSELEVKRLGLLSAGENTEVHTLLETVEMIKEKYLKNLGCV